MCVMIKEAELFDEWKKIRPEFSPDGIIDENLYFDSHPRIMFVLKEVNSQSGKSIDLKKFLRNGAYDRKQSWDNVARWVYGLRNLDKEIAWKELGNREMLDVWRIQLLPSICVINVKKSPGIHTSNHDLLHKAAEEDKKYLNDQFQLYFNEPSAKPDLIICGGSFTSNVFNNHVNIPNKNNWQETTRGIWYYEFEKDKFFIYYSHPEARVADNILYYGLIDAVKEIMPYESPY